MTWSPTPASGTSANETDFVIPPNDTVQALYQTSTKVNRSSGFSFMTSSNGCFVLIVYTSDCHET